MKTFLDVLIVLVSMTVTFSMLFALVRRLNAKLVERGILPGPELPAVDLPDVPDDVIDEILKQGMPLSRATAFARARMIARGTSPSRFPTPAAAQLFDNALRSAELIASVRRMPAGLAEATTMREHMQIVDVHLLRAQDYVVALGADGRGPELALLFKRLRLARKALRAAAQAQPTPGDRGAE